MSRHRNTGSQEKIKSDQEVEESFLYHEDETKFASGKYDLPEMNVDLETLFAQGLRYTLIGSKLLIQSVYSFLPFVMMFYLYDIYNTSDDSLYKPDLPNAFHESSIAEFNDIGVEFYDLADFRSTNNGWQNNERILFLVPLRDASAHLPMFFDHMRNLTYPHNLIDMSFLISDTSDSTLEDLQGFLNEFQNDPDKSQRFGRIEIYEKDFGQIVGQSFSDRHGFAAQGPRRKLMAIARNWLLTTALKPDHAWVYWRDIDVETCPATVLEDLMHHDRDVIVPNIWRPLPDWLGYEQAYDLNSWQESEGGVELADRLDEDAVIVEGYPEYATWRPHLAYLRDPYGDPEVEVELDGIGGVSILSKAHVFRRGAMFPAFSFKKHAETEAFGKLCKTMGFDVIGLPHYVIWHIYEPSTDDLKHMEWLANEELRQKELLKNKEFYDRAWELAFQDVSDEWQEEKFNVFKNTDLSKLGIGTAHWDEVDEYLAEIDDSEYEENEAHNDESFVVNFLDKKNELFEQGVLEKLRTGPRKFGQNPSEFVFGDYNNIDGIHKEKKLKFKKFEDPYIPGKDGDEANELEGTYDLKSDKIVDNSKSSQPISEVSDNTLNKDKQLFDGLEQEKLEADGVEEGEVEFKAQQPIEEAANKKKKDQEMAKKASQQNVIRTLYEVDDEGYTVATVVQTLRPKETKTPRVSEDKKDDVNSPNNPESANDEDLDLYNLVDQFQGV